MVLHFTGATSAVLEERPLLFSTGVIQTEDADVGHEPAELFEKVMRDHYGFPRSEVVSISSNAWVPKR